MHIAIINWVAIAYVVVFPVIFVISVKGFIPIISGQIYINIFAFTIIGEWYANGIIFYRNSSGCWLNIPPEGEISIKVTALLRYSMGYSGLIILKIMIGPSAGSACIIISTIYSPSSSPPPVVVPTYLSENSAYVILLAGK